MKNAQEIVETAQTAVKAAGLFASLLALFKDEKEKFKLALLRTNCFKVMGWEEGQEPNFLKFEDDKPLQHEHASELKPGNWEHQLSNNALRSICITLCVKIKNYQLDKYHIASSKFNKIKQCVTKENIFISAEFIFLAIIKHEIYQLSIDRLDESKLKKINNLRQLIDETYVNIFADSDKRGKLVGLRTEITDGLKEAEKLIEREVSKENAVRNFELFLENLQVLIEQELMFSFFVFLNVVFKKNISPNMFHDLRDQQFSEIRHTFPARLLTYLLSFQEVAAIFPKTFELSEDLNALNISPNIKRPLLRTSPSQPIIMKENPFCNRRNESNNNNPPNYRLPLNFLNDTYAVTDDNSNKNVAEILCRIKGNGIEEEFLTEENLSDYFKLFALLLNLISVRTCFYNMRKIGILGGNLFAYKYADTVVNSIIVCYQKIDEELFKTTERIYERGCNLTKAHVTSNNRNTVKAFNRKSLITDRDLKKAAPWRRDNFEIAKKHFTRYNECRTKCNNIVNRITNEIHRKSTQQIVNELIGEVHGLLKNAKTVVKMNLQLGLNVDQEQIILNPSLEQQLLQPTKLQTLGTTTQPTRLTLSNNNTYSTRFFDQKYTLVLAKFIKHLHKKNYQKILKKIDNSIANFPNQIELRLIKIEALLEKDKQIEEDSQKQSKIDYQYLKEISLILDSDKFNQSDKNQVLYFKAKLLFSSKKFNEAEIELKSILESEPENSDAKKLLETVQHFAHTTSNSRFLSQ